LGWTLSAITADMLGDVVLQAKESSNFSAAKPQFA